MFASPWVAALLQRVSRRGQGVCDPSGRLSARIWLPGGVQVASGGSRGTAGTKEPFGPPCAASQERDSAVVNQRTPRLRCNRGRAPKAPATCFLLIAASILPARKLAQYDGGKRVPATVSAIADALRWAEEIMAEIDRRWPTRSTGQRSSDRRQAQ